MSTRRILLLAALLAAFALLSLPAAPARAAAAAQPAAEVCSVCRVHEGEADPEPVRATSVYKGTTYGFCSAECKVKFEEDPEAYVPPVLPRPLPAFTVQGLDGKEVAFSSVAAGRAVLVDFWATWCAPCISAMPRLQKLHQRYGSRGFAVVGLSIDEQQDAARRLAQKKKLAYPVYLDATATPAWSVLHVRAIPALFLVDAEGRIVRQWLGKTDLAEIEREVARLVGS